MITKATGREPYFKFYVDDWIAGVHLDSRHGRVWFHDGHTLIRGQS